MPAAAAPRRTPASGGSSGSVTASGEVGTAMVFPLGVSYGHVPWAFPLGVFSLTAGQFGQPRVRRYGLGAGGGTAVSVARLGEPSRLNSSTVTRERASAKAC